MYVPNNLPSHNPSAPHALFVYYRSDLFLLFPFTFLQNSYLLFTKIPIYFLPLFPLLPIFALSLQIVHLKSTIFFSYLYIETFVFKY